MAKPGRPGISYEKFVHTWEQLSQEGRAGTNTVLDILGGNKSTISAYRERYEREKASKELALIKDIKLTEAVNRAIAEIKVQEIEALEKVNAQLSERNDEYLTSMKEAEEKYNVALLESEDLKKAFSEEKLNFERKLAAAEARIDDMVQREVTMGNKNDQLTEQLNLAKQEAAVAKKEIEMLREQFKKKP